METIILVLMVWISPTEMGKIEAEFRTLEDCVTASAIIGVFPDIYSANCVTVSDGEVPVDYSVERGA